MTPIRKRMLKAIEGKFTAREADKRIKRFLDYPVGCPWEAESVWSSCDEYGGKICKAMFPRLRKDSAELYFCPCAEHTTKHVIKRATEALK